MLTAQQVKDRRFQSRLKDLRVDHIVVTPEPHPYTGQRAMQLNGTLLDGSTAWLSIHIDPEVLITMGVPYEKEDE